jgi:RecA/RadA recombinase
VAAGKRRSSKESAADRVDALLVKHGGLIRRASEITSPWSLKRLPTGLANLDVDLRGGWPAGCFVMLIGEPGVGKNTLSNHTIAEQQRIVGDSFMCFIGITEGSLDKSQMRLNGVKIADSPEELNAFVQARKRAGLPVTRSMIRERQEQIGEFIVVQGETSDVIYQAVLDAVATRAFHVVLLDSFGSVLLDQDKEKELVDNDRMAGPAGLNSKFSTRLFSALGPDKDGNPNLTLVIGINQIRANMNRANPNSPMTSESGGYQLKHTRSVAVQLSTTGKITDKDASKESGGRVREAKNIMYEVTKQKAGGHEGGSGTYLHRFKGGIHKSHALLRTAEQFGVVKHTGNTYRVDIDGETITIGNSRGLMDAADALEELDELHQMIYDMVIEVAAVEQGWDQHPLYGVEELGDESGWEVVEDVEETGSSEEGHSVSTEYERMIREAIKSEDREVVANFLREKNVSFRSNAKFATLAALAEKTLLQALQ